MKRFKLMIFSLGAVCLLSSKCKEKPVTTAEFDKTTLLNNVADNLIVPGYNSLSTSLSDLKMALETFATDFSDAHLTDVQDKWFLAYKDFEAVQMYNFGPAKDYGFKGACGTYPTDTTKINANIANGSYVLGAIANVDAIGFPALDYILFDLGNDVAKAKLSSQTERYNYAMAVITKMLDEVNLIKSAWNSTYLSAFKASTGTSSTSSLSYLVNEFNKDFELTKNGKFAIPIGALSLGIARPEYIEAPFSGKSLELIDFSFSALNDLYLGGKGVGFDDYLLSLETNGIELNTKIKDKFTAITSNLAQYNNTLKTEINNGNANLNASYDLIQSQIINIKTDMPALFGVFITYQDNDGD